MAVRLCKKIAFKRRVGFVAHTCIGKFVVTTHSDNGQAVARKIEKKMWNLIYGVFSKKILVFQYNVLLITLSRPPNLFFSVYCRNDFLFFLEDMLNKC